jgi:hypothetical protein
MIKFSSNVDDFTQTPFWIKKVVIWWLFHDDLSVREREEKRTRNSAHNTVPRTGSMYSSVPNRSAEPCALEKRFSKGQTISKANNGVLNSPKKWENWVDHKLLLRLTDL